MIFRFLMGLFLSVGLLGGVSAEKADRLRPINAEADSLRYDDAHQTSIFTGNVIITKGSILIKAARVEVRQDAQGHQYGTLVGEALKPAFFKQKREAVDEYIEGTAQRIEYDGQQDQVQFVGTAVLRRYKGATLVDETTGARIFYDNARNTFTVEGSALPKAVDNKSGGRVRTMLTPHLKENETPLTPPPMGSMDLRPSSSIDVAR